MEWTREAIKMSRGSINMPREDTANSQNVGGIRLRAAAVTHRVKRSGSKSVSAATVPSLAKAVILSSKLDRFSKCRTRRKLACGDLFTFGGVLVCLSFAQLWQAVARCTVARITDSSLPSIDLRLSGQWF